LQTLLELNAAPATKLDAIVDDVDSIIGTANLDSLLTVTARDGAQVASHVLQSLTLNATGSKTSYLIAEEPLPVVRANEVALTYETTTLSLAEHGFTLRLPTFWERAVNELALKSRFNLSPPIVRNFLTALINAAQKNGKVGCLAVEELLCAQPGVVSCAGTVGPACTTALDQIDVALRQPFTAPTGLDLIWSGTATAADSDGDLFVDKLSAGDWSLFDGRGTFTGSR
jgi:hypothetical protein